MILSIIYINYNTRGLLKQSLKHLFMTAPALDFEVIVVDNDSSDGSVDMLKNNFPKIKIVRSKKNLGYAGGVNLGIKNSKGAYIAIFNPDIFIMKNSLELMVNYLDNNLSVGIVGPKLINADGSLQHSCFRYPKLFIPILRRTFLGNTNFGKKELDKYLMKDFDHKESMEVDWLLGGALIIRKSTLEKINYLDERYFLYFEDTDLCRQSHSAGYKVVYFPSSKIIHLHQRESVGSSALKSLFKKTTREHIKSGIKYFLKYR